MLIKIFGDIFIVTMYSNTTLAQVKKKFKKIANYFKLSIVNFTC